MRKIKFRAWNKQYKIMCYDNEDNTANYWDGYYNSVVGTLNYILLDDGKSFYELMQYTGLKDKKGKEIYEGDILKIENIDYAKVYYDEDRMAWGLQAIGEWYLDSPLLSDSTNLDLLVVGNIYDNPELLD